VRHSIKHELSPEQLKLAVSKFAEAYVERYREYDTKALWLQDDKVEVQFKVKGVKLSGVLELLPREIGIDMKVPLPLQLFRSRAIRTIEETVAPWLEKAKRGELS
jgi:hypothetical protein